MRLRIVIRTDADAALGTGHVMRCLALAGALRRQGVSVTFCCRSLDGHLMDLIRAQGNDVLAIPPSRLATPSDQVRDADAMVAALGDNRVHGCIVDHYSLSAAWESRVRHYCGRMIVIDDLANRRHECDVLVDFNLLHDQGGRYAGLIPRDCDTLFGPDYLLLREEFARPPEAPRAPVAIDRTLVLFGGVDEANRSAEVLRFLAEAVPSPGHVDVVAGRVNPHVDTLRRLCREHAFDLHVGVDRVADLMAGADVAISACGMTAYELVAMGVPAILVPVSVIQDSVARSLALAGFAVTLPLSVRLPLGVLRHEWTALAGNRVRRSAMTHRARGAVDGEGAGRTAKRLLQVIRDA